ncbi:hypothetical protein [Shinella pollutisoli]|uniref:Uncharacterized protein n=1 Tax=Shinella pollutisoli TaxID=2250594 RepID=A0ABV7DK19_9HYPH|nr:hypothetical protein [Shinella pollutisoli]
MSVVLSISSIAVIAAFRDQKVSLPLRLSDEDIGVVLDDDGVDVVTVDVNGERPDGQATAIAMMIVSAVNHLAGIEPTNTAEGNADE